MKKVELLAPAGDLTRAKIAILYGANAVFCGGKELSLRAKANNFTLSDLKELVMFANAHDARVHVTVNIVPFDDDLTSLDKYLMALDEVHIHAIIVSSIYIMKRAKELGCHFEVHVSTQQSIANHLAINFFKEKVNANRVVLARELNIDELAKIKEKSSLPIEAFIHGGMCSSFSGRCGLSNVMVNRDANKGGCAHSCRWLYYLYDGNNKISDNIFSIASSDLMSIDYLPSMLNIGINSFKIEGRMKSAHYIASIVSVYSRLINEYYENNNLSKERLRYYKKEIAKAENRVTSVGFLKQKMKNEGILANIGSENPTQSFIAFVLEDSKDGFIKVETRNYFKVNDKIEIFMPSGKCLKSKIYEIRTLENEVIEVSNHPKDILYLKVKKEVISNSFVRLKV